jgi:hypothetical protein
VPNQRWGLIERQTCVPEPVGHVTNCGINCSDSNMCTTRSSQSSKRLLNDHSVRRFVPLAHR